MENYIVDENSGIFLRPESTGIGYSDGVEKNLLEVVSKVTDRSTLSADFVQHMTDWPSEYHFSRKRHLILRPFEIKRGDRVLELGAGCGAITRYLAEIGAHVTTVEGEKSRARVAAKRCEGFSNVRFIVDNFISLNLREKFDWVLMIGVFEYSQRYAETADRQREYLDIARRHLNSNGNLIIAIENKLGLKYLNGAGEDHNGKRFYGAQDLYSGDDITTWGRKEIQEIIANAGFEHSKVFAVFPDYKLPKVILSEDIDDNRKFRSEELIHYVKSLDYRGKNERVFDESLVLSSLRKNGLVVDFANSFIISCGLKHSKMAYDPKILAHYFSVDRKASFCTETKFLLEVNGNISVLKNPIAQNGNASERPIYITDETGGLIQLIQRGTKAASAYLDGRLLGFEISRALQREDLRAFKDILVLWIEFLKTSFKFSCRYSSDELITHGLHGRELHSVMIEGGALDCGPHNIIFGEAISTFDLEWHSEQHVPLSWIIHRNAKLLLRPGHASKFQVKIDDLFGFLADKIGVLAKKSDIDEALNLERQFQSAIALIEPSTKKSLSNAFNLN